mmetsp:Transcript_16048/g.27452  ORF Transcript_16048/g.27452 Transcript_16048/m.27452 type:complete len:425 (+) Transcript_16048:460-1734(+)
MSKIVANVVATKRFHGKRVWTQQTSSRLCSCCSFRVHHCTHKCTVLPVQRLIDQWHNGRTTTAKDDGVDRHASGIFPGWIDHRALRGRRCETRVGMRCWLFRGRCPEAAQPTGCTGRRLFRHAFPPHVVVRSQRHIGEQRVAFHGTHRVRVGVVGRAWCNAKEAVLWVDGAQFTVWSESHPSNIITDRFDFPTRQIWQHHCQIRFTTSTWKCSGNISFFALWVGDAENQHVFSQPAFVASHCRSNAQRKAFFAQQRITTISTTVAHDFACFWKVNDVFVVGVARPRRVLLAFGQRFAKRVHAWHEEIIAQHFDHIGAHACHDAHVGHHKRRVRHFDTNRRQFRAKRTHAERHNIHGSAFHTAAKQFSHFAAHFTRWRPVVERTSVTLLATANIGARLDARHIADVTACVVRIRAFGRVQRDQRA